MVLLTKADISQRQLDVAISLYFDSGDLVSAWTLGAAAYNVLRDIRKTRPEISPMLLKEQLPANFESEERVALVQKIQKVENFLKHADKDPHDSIDFNPIGQIELLLFDASLKFLEIFGFETVNMALIRMWFLTAFKIEHDEDPHFTDWLDSVRRLANERPGEYRARLWPEAERIANQK